ncbi:hypothetical protein Rhopal_003455-T1 [Rhodotorula paludigena]|uniref:Histone deacetylase domain-containing protein n=1 Tax=Rhodotorula paludigena TaxID=86838 RepID=A0AAV5GJ44_9BASI|nr:hypothetical protein Rhopal_003455-T1 [Rhodotorula paludigena]
MRLESLARTGYIWCSIFGWYNPGNNPLLPADHRVGLAPLRNTANPDTKRLAHELIDVTGLLRHLHTLDFTPATKEDVLLVHHEKYVNRVELESNHTGGDCGDGASPFGRGAYDIALHGLGAALSMLKAVVKGEVRNGYTLMHPPGHHAEPDTGRGQCMFNNGAISAEYALRNLGMRKVAIVDVHVLTISVHQDRNFPADTGMAEHRGEGKGFGYNFNIPLLPGCGNGAYEYTLETLVLPALWRYKPDLIIVASGLDAGIMDPLARQSVTNKGFVSITKKLMRVADELGHGRLVYLQEGIHRIIETLAGVQTLEVDPYEGFLDTQYGSALEPWQKKAIDRLVPHLDDIK